MELLNALLNLLEALLAVFASLGAMIAPWWPLIAWIAFWTLAVDWRKLYAVFWSGGWIGLALLWFTMILVWGCMAPPDGGYHHILGLSVTNFFGKMMYVTGLYVIMFLCGSVQLSGLCDRYLDFSEPEMEVAPHHDDHAHGDHH